MLHPPAQTTRPHLHSLGGLLLPLLGTGPANTQAAWEAQGGVLLSWAGVLGALLLLGLCNALSIWLGLWCWERTHRTARRREHLLWELHCCKLWPGRETRARKEALIHALNGLGATSLDLEHAALGGAELAGAVLRGARMASAELPQANLRGADLRQGMLFGANLEQADFSRADLRGANLRGADLREACLVKVDLRGANLHRALLMGANLEGARLEGARLERACFADVQLGLFEQLHPSVEDWIRAALDERGCYQEAKAAAVPATQEREEV